MRRMWFVLVIILLFPIVAFAGNQAGSHTFTIAGAYYHFDPRRHLANSAVPNFSYAYNFTDRWAAEGTFGIFNTSQRQSQSNQHSGVHGYLYLLDAIYRFTPKNRWEPYVSFGIGATTLYPQLYDSEHQGNINAGIGTQFFADKMIALRGEVKDLYSVANGKNDVMANFGVSLVF